LRGRGGEGGLSLESGERAEEGAEEGGGGSDEEGEEHGGRLSIYKG